MRRRLSLALAAVALIGLSGCATPWLQIDATKYPAPKSIAIADFPELRALATVQPNPVWVQAAYFTESFDYFYELPGDTESQSSRFIKPGSSSYGLIGAVLDANAADTERKAAQFPVLVKQQLKVSLRSSLLDALTRAFEARGVAVKLMTDTRNEFPSARWSYTQGERNVTGTKPDSAPIDADLYVQLAPVAIYAAPGPLNAYSARVHIGVLVYDARTRKYLGMQLFRTGGDLESFHVYTDLERNVPKIAPQLQASLLSQVPLIVEAVVGKQPRP